MRSRRGLLRVAHTDTACHMVQDTVTICTLNLVQKQTSEMLADVPTKPGIAALSNRMVRTMGLVS